MTTFFGCMAQADACFGIMQTDGVPQTDNAVDQVERRFLPILSSGFLECSTEQSAVMA